jgi:hypothetical protein
VTAPTAVPGVLDYLVATATASAALGQATPPVTVIDGPQVTDGILIEQPILWIGHDPLNPGEVAATSALDWPVLDHARTADEDGEVTCTARYWSGDTTVKPNRDGCAAIVGAVAGLLKGDATTSGPGDTSMGGLVFWSRVSETSWSQAQRSDGAAVVCVFKIMYRARITV